MSIRVVANNYVREDAIEKFLEITKELVEKTNALDAGCISYQLARDLNDPMHFAVIEEWADMASLEAHMKAAHFIELIPQLDGCSSDKEGGITLFDRVF